MAVSQKASEVEGNAPANQLVRLLHCTGHYLDPEAGLLRTCVQWTAIAVVMTLGIYQAGWLFYNNVLRCGVNLFMLRFVIWTSKGIAVQLFLLHAQLRGHIQRMLERLFRPFPKDGAEPLTRNVRWICAASVCVYLLLISIGFGYFALLRQLQIVDRGKTFNYGALSQIVIRNLMWWSTMWLVTSSLVVYNVCASLMLSEVDQFNQCTRKVLDQKQNPNVQEALAEHYLRYLELLNGVECLNRTFQVYLFVMLSLNIPITISTLLRLFRVSGNQFVFIVPETMYCLYEIGALTVLAARLETKVKKIPKTFYMATPLRAICEDDTRIRALIIHVTNQPNLGITLWDFAIISKPLILTVISIMVSYLTIVVQVFPGDNDGIAVKSSRQTNSTIIC